MFVDPSYCTGLLRPRHVNPSSPLFMYVAVRGSSVARSREKTRQLTVHRDDRK